MKTSRLVYHVVLSLTVAVFALAACGDGESKEQTFELEIRDGGLVQTESRLIVKQGDMVTIVVSTDEPISFHLHGYDIEKTATPEEPAQLVFEADGTGSFPYTIHVVGDGHADEHNEGAEDCEATVPAGALAPEIRVKASPGEKSGEISVTVEVDNFILSDRSTRTNLASGHWHLFVDHKLKGMYTQPEVTTSASTAGEHEVMVGLSDTAHCDYGIEAMTMVTVAEGHEEDEREKDKHEEDGEEEHEEEIELGRLDVLP